MIYMYDSINYYVHVIWLFVNWAIYGDVIVLSFPLE